MGSFSRENGPLGGSCLTLVLAKTWEQKVLDFPIIQQKNKIRAQGLGPDSGSQNLLPNCRDSVWGLQRLNGKSWLIVNVYVKCLEPVPECT